MTVTSTGAVLHLAKNFLVRSLPGETEFSEVSWGEGSQRCYYKFPQELAVLFMTCPADGSRQDWLDRLAGLGVEAEEAAELLRTVEDDGLLTPETQQLTPGEEQWLDVEWSDALQLHWAEKDCRWDHDYTNNPKVMTRYRGENVVPSTPPPGAFPCVPAAGKQAVVLPDAVELDRPFREVQHQRRTAYQFENTVVTLEDVATILSWTTKARWSDGVSPLRVTQSYSRGEPFVAFVAFGDTPPDGCAPRTVYQYDPASNVLSPLVGEGPAQWSELLWGQQFGDGAPMAMILATNWEQFQWKYRFPRAYRWTYTECGAFLQTALTVATGLGLRTWQTPALDDERVGRLLGHEEHVLGATYLAVFGRPRAEHR
jgi:nitroreductase